MNIQQVAFGLAVVAVSVGMSVWFGGTETMERVVERTTGAFAGPERLETMFFRQGFTVGDAVTSTTTPDTLSAYTLTNHLVDVDRPYVEITNNANITLTTMASTSAPFSGLSPGESFEQLWYNASTTAAATVTFAAGTGVDLQEYESGSVIVNGLETARVTYVKKADTDVAVIVEPYQVGD